jgi:HEAT repeat protein
MNPDDIRRLVRELESAGPDMPRDAMAALAAAGEDAVAPLLELLDSMEPDEDDWTPLWIAVTLGETRSVRAVPALLRMLELPEGDVLSEAAAESLAKVGKPALPLLLPFAGNAPSWEVRQYAYAAIGLIPDDESLRFLIAALDRDAMLWSSLAMALADLGDARALPALKALLPKCDEREAPAVSEAIAILEGRQPPYPKQHTRDWQERYGWLTRPGDAA